MGAKITIRKTLIGILAVLVVFVTVFSLVLPAVALTNDAAHTDSGINLGTVNNSETQTDSLSKDNTEPVDNYNQETVTGQNTVAVEEENEPLKFYGEAGDSIVYVEAPFGTFDVEVTMVVKEVFLNSEQYDLINDQVEDKNVKVLKALDISFIGSDGAEIEPNEGFNVKVSISNKELSEIDNAFVAHIDDKEDTTSIIEEVETKTEDLEVLTNTDEITEIVGNNENIEPITVDNTVTFETDSFSLYVLAYTVDFYYGEYEYHLEAESEIGLLQLFNKLGIEFSIDDIESVTFSNPDLVAVYQVEGNWILSSKQAFDTVETLTIKFKDGGEIIIRVEDAQYTNDLNSLMTDISIKVNGEIINNNETISIARGDKFNIHIVMSENEQYQFVNNDSNMIFRLPDGVKMDDDFSTFVTVNMGIDGKVYRNPLVYDKDTNSLIFRWNTEDPNFNKLKASGDASVIFDVEAFFDGTQNSVSFSTELNVNVNITEAHDVDLVKTGTLVKTDTEHPENAPRIEYIVTATSSGNNSNVVIEDILGSALVLKTPLNISSNKDNSTIGTPTTGNNGFSLIIGQMSDGEIITIAYSAKVDTSKIQNVSNATFDEVGNKASLSGDNIPDKEKTHYDHEISVNNSHKISTGTSEITVVDGKKIQSVDWKIIVNENPTESYAGTKIKDSISSNSTDIMSYDTNKPISLIVKDASGNVVSSRSGNLNWSDLGVTSQNNKTWEYNIPDDDGVYSYEINYSTIVDVTDKTQIGQVNNNIETKGGNTTGTANVGPKPEDQKINYSKTKLNVSPDEVEWSITITVDQGEYSNFEVVDVLPFYVYGDKGYVDEYKTGSLKIFGLMDNEPMPDIVPIYENQDSTAYINTNENNKANKIKFVFYKNLDKQNPGLIASSQRTITIQLTTINSQGWIELAKQQNDEALLKHINKVQVNGYSFKEAQAVPMTRTVFKYRNNADKTPQSFNRMVELNGINYPLFTFRVVVGGVNQNSVSIEDYFDTDLFKIHYGDDDNVNPQVWGGNGDKKYAHTKRGSNLTWDETINGKVVFTANNIPMDDNVYYDFYMFEYNLIPKDENALKTIRELALSNDNSIIFDNVAKYGDSEDELKFKFDYNVLDKTSVIQKDNETGITSLNYTIKINPDKVKMNGGYKADGSTIMDMTDTYSNNLSIDFGSIKVTVDPSERSHEVTWDYSRNVGTFKIPDETAVTITYSAKAIGEPNSLQTVTNTAYIIGYSDSDTKDIAAYLSGEGTASINRVRLFKYERNHMETGLNGAIFRILDQNKNPILDKQGNQITFETKRVLINKDGLIINFDDPIPKKYNESTQTYEDGYYDWELTAEGYSRKQTPGYIVKYSDLQDSALTSRQLTIRDGYVEISLDESKYGTTLRRERAYYLEEIKTPTKNENGEIIQFEKDYIQYSFLITDKADYTAPDGVYVYHNNDILTVKNSRSDGSSLKVSKKFNGNVSLSNEQKNNVTFILQKLNEQTGIFEDFAIDVFDQETNSVVQRSEIKYGDKKNADGDPLFENGILTISNISSGTYKVIECNAVFDQNVTLKTEYLVDGNKQTSINNGVSVLFSDDDINNNVNHDISITNTYFTNKLEIIKVSSKTAALLGGAKFKVYKALDDSVNTNVGEISTGSDGKATILFDNSIYSENTLYYIKETTAPAGYILPSEPVKYYFYFSSSGWTPGNELPQGETAVNLATDYNTVTIPNDKDDLHKSLNISKSWIDSDGNDISDSIDNNQNIELKLYRCLSYPTSGLLVTNGNYKNKIDVSELIKISLLSKEELFLPGDSIQITVKGIGNTDVTNAGINQTPYVDNFKEIIKTSNIKSWSYKFADEYDKGDLVLSIYGISGDYEYEINNVTANNRVLLLNQTEASQIEKADDFVRTVVLNKLNSWSAEVDNLDIKNGEGYKYFYYLVETDGDSYNAVYEVGKDNVKIINTKSNIEASLRVIKVDKDDDSLLGGAIFRLEKYSDSKWSIPDSSFTIQTKTTPLSGNDKGKITFDGLSEGYYKLKEVQSPSGYVKNSKDPCFELIYNSSDKQWTVNYDDSSNLVIYNNMEFTIKNEAGRELPDAGSFGTLLFVTTGIGLMSFASIIYFFKTRHKERRLN